MPRNREASPGFQAQVMGGRVGAKGPGKASLLAVTASPPRPPSGTSGVTGRSLSPHVLLQTTPASNLRTSERPSQPRGPPAPHPPCPTSGGHRTDSSPSNPRALCPLPLCARQQPHAPCLRAQRPLRHPALLPGRPGAAGPQPCVCVCRLWPPLCSVTAVPAPLPSWYAVGAPRVFAGLMTGGTPWRLQPRPPCLPTQGTIQKAPRASVSSSGPGK